MAERMNVVDKIRKLCGVEHGGDWVFEKGKVREGKLLKEAVEEIAGLHEALARCRSRNEDMYWEVKAAKNEAREAAKREAGTVREANSRVREFKGLAEAILSVEFVLNTED